MTAQLPYFKMTQAEARQCVVDAVADRHLKVVMFGSTAADAEASEMVTQFDRAAAAQCYRRATAAWYAVNMARATSSCAGKNKDIQDVETRIRRLASALAHIAYPNPAEEAEQ